MLRESVYTTDDSTEWSSVLPVQESVFGSVEFGRIAEEYFGYQARLYVLQDHTSRIAYPFFLRPIRSLPLNEQVSGRLTDTASPDFTGPLGRGGPAESLAMEFPNRFSAFARNQGTVAEFIHLHPWKALTGALLGHCLQLDREIIYVDLTWPEEEIWRTFTHACRKNISRSKRENVRVFEAQTMGDIREFYRLYIQTMKARNALPQYYFSAEYFAAIFEELRSNARFVLAEHRGQIVAGTLYLHDRDDVYSYLGGADRNSQHVRPTNAIIYNTILWGKTQGKRRLVLGGGYLPNDGIFRFKASFSPERAKFFVYKCVHLPEEYAALCRSWSSAYGRDWRTTSYFPPYRFSLPSESPHPSARVISAVVASFGGSSPEARNNPSGFCRS